MAKSVAEVQEEIFNEIDAPENKISLKVQKKMIDRTVFLSDIKQRCLKEGLDDEECDDIVFLVDKALWGFGVIDECINDDSISDIRLTAPGIPVRVKRNGVREDTNIVFNTKDKYINFVSHITMRNNTNMSIGNAAQVFTDKDSSESNILRFSLVSELINTNGVPSLLIRKISKKKKDFEKLISPSENYMTQEQADYLAQRWIDGHGILVCGPNGSGKTTLVNAILEATPHDKSAVVVQESEELFCDNHPEMIFRKVIPPRSNSTISYTLKDVCKLALMESFDIIVVGEIKGDEAAELAYATYTGSQSMTTVHSISAEEGYNKIIDYALDAQPTRTKEHFAKQFQRLDTIVYVENYHIKQILKQTSFNKETGEFNFEEVQFNNGGMISG